MVNSHNLTVIYQIVATVQYECSTDGNHIVTILEAQQSKIQQFVRRIGVKLPLYKKTELDPYASFVFLQIDGATTVQQIGELLQEQFGNNVTPLYERLKLFLDYLEQAGLITRV